MSFASSQQSVGAQPQQLNGINVDSSRYGLPITLGYGMQRIPVNLGWYGAFTSTPQTQSGSGKGGGGSPVTGWQYSASAVMLMCEGPLPRSPYIRQVWKDKTLTSLANEGLTLFLGSSGQAPWSYLTSGFPGQDIGYDLTAYLAGENLNLGSTAAMPNYTVEALMFLCPGPAHTVSLVGTPGAGSINCVISGASPVADGTYNVSFTDFETRRATLTTVSGTTTVTWDTNWPLTANVGGTMTIGGFDADPSAILIDYTTDPTHGCDFPYLNQTQIQSASWVSGLTTYFNSYKIYCEANGIALSPFEDSQRPASGFLQDILEMTNSDCFCSGLNLNIVPLGDTTVTGNGATFTPNLQPWFSFDDDDYRPNTSGSISDPVIVDRKEKTETFNVARVEFLDRGNNYNACPAEWKDSQDIAANGERVMSTKTFHPITSATVAYLVAGLVGQRNLYIRRTFIFSVRGDLYSLLEPMDLVAITDPNLGIFDLLVRVNEIEDDGDDTITITAEDMLVGTASAPVFDLQDAQGFYANYSMQPAAVAAPVVFSVPASLVGPAGGYRLAIACGPAALTGAQMPFYGGCNIYGSLDDLTWTFLGTIAGSARFGTVTTSHAISASTPGASDTFHLTMASEVFAEGWQLDSATPADFAANRALLYVDGEIVAFETVTLVGTAQYTVTVTRGLFGTAAAAHAAGASWARLDQAIFYFDFDAGMIGETLYLELFSFNKVGQAIAATPTLANHVIENFNVGQLVGGPLTLLGTGVGIVGNSAYSINGSTNGLWSEQSYTNGCFMSFRPRELVASEKFVGLNRAQGVLGVSGELDLSFRLDAGGALYVGYFQGGFYASQSLFTSYAIGDTLTISYDGNVARWMQNGNQVYQLSVPTAVTLFLYADFIGAGASIGDITFGPYGLSNPALFGVTGAVIVADSYAFKYAGSSAWDSSFFSLQGFPTCNFVFKASQTNAAIAAGFTLQPVNPVSSIVAGWYFVLDASGNWTVQTPAGTPVGGVSGVYDLTTRFSGTFDGTTLRLLANNAVVYSTTSGLSGVNLWMQGAVFTPNAGLQALDWGPGSTIPVIDTTGIGLNAATGVESTSVVGPDTWSISV